MVGLRIIVEKSWDGLNGSTADDVIKVESLYRSIFQDGEGKQYNNLCILVFI